MRAAALLLTLLAPAAIASSCGKSQQVVTRTVTAQAGGAPGASPKTPPATAPSKSQVARAQAFARAVNLTSADLPGYVAIPQSQTGKTSAQLSLNREVRGCEGATSEQPVAEVGSSSFQRASSNSLQTVRSGVTVARSAALATSELNVLRSARARACFARYFGKVLTGPAYRRARVGPISIAHGTPPAPGTSGAFGWRVSTTLVTASTRVPLYLDILGFAYGRSEVSLFSSGFLLPFPAAAEQRLFMALLARARARRL